MWKPDVIMLGPAGAKGLLFIGCLKRLYREKEFLSNVQTWSGVSAGAAVCLLIVMGYEIEEIIDICMDLNILEDIMGINLDRAREKLGLIPNKTVENKLKSNIVKKFGYIPSLKELYLLTGVHLVLVTYNLDKFRVEYLDKDTEPNLSCLEAAMMSMAIPGLIEPRKYKGQTYVDGAIGAPYPVLHFDIKNNKVLGMYVSSEEDLYCSDKTPGNYAYRVLQASMRTLRDFEIAYSSSNVKNIPLKTLVKDTTGISIDKATREKMIDYGYYCGDSFLKVASNPEKYDYNLKENEEIPFEL